MNERYESFDLVGSLTGLGQRHASVGAALQLVAGRTGTGLTGTLGASRADNTWRSWAMVPTISYRGLHGFAVRYSSLPVATSDLFSVLDSTGTAFLTFAVTSTGAIAVYRGTSGGTLLGTSAAGFVSTIAYRYLEFDWIIRNAPEGVCEIHSIPVSGSSMSYVLTGLDTLPATSTPWVSTETYLLDGLPTIDDCYWNNGNGVLRGGFRGAISLQVATPVTLASNHVSRWVASTGGNIPAVLDDIPANLDIDYMYARLPALMDVTMGTITGTGTVVGVQISAVARSVSSVELGRFRLAFRTGSTQSGDTHTTTTAYDTYLELTTFDPATLGPWTIALVNAAFFGIHRVNNLT